MPEEVPKEWPVTIDIVNIPKRRFKASAEDSAKGRSIDLYYEQENSHKRKNSFLLKDTQLSKKLRRFTELNDKSYAYGAYGDCVFEEPSLCNLDDSDIDQINFFDDSEDEDAILSDYPYVNNPVYTEMPMIDDDFTQEEREELKLCLEEEEEDSADCYLSRYQNLQKHSSAHSHLSFEDSPSDEVFISARKLRSILNRGIVGDSSLSLKNDL